MEKLQKNSGSTATAGAAQPAWNIEPALPSATVGGSFRGRYPGSSAA
jgi:hypothetical protein